MKYKHSRSAFFTRASCAKNRSRNRIFLSCLIAFFACLAQAADNAAAIARQVEALLSRDDLAAYRGWLKYLRADAEQTATRSGAGSVTACEKWQRLASWADRIAANPRVIHELRGPQEWAYESPADGSGQPFRINIPADMPADINLPASAGTGMPLRIGLHGYSQNHLENTSGYELKTGGFDVAVLGRARGGWYHALSEADVLDVLDYVIAHWPVDPARIHIGGASMGGQGALRIAARHPHRFASVFTQCANFMQQPADNLLNTPFYATHSRDDFVVPFAEDQAMHAHLQMLGAPAVFDETDKLGHAAWDYVEGNRRAYAWTAACRRLDLRVVARIDYTALDGGAVRAWWASIAQWGDVARPARFILNASAGSQPRLYATLENITRLRLALADSPFAAMRGQPLEIIINGRPALTQPAPLPDAVVLVKNDSNVWSVEANPAVAPVPSHAPGGPARLYDGTPLLIVHGTHGDAAANKAMREAAIAASKSPNPSWAVDGGEKSNIDGVPHHQNLYGRLTVKPDIEVSDDDIARCHLVLIGDAAQNTVVARMAELFPLRLDAAARKIVCSDGITFPAEQQTLALSYHNPLAPNRFVYWVASTEAAGYAPGAFAPALSESYFHAADLVVTSATGGRLVATRTFDSRWRWHDFAGGHENPAMIPASFERQSALACAIADCARQATGANFAVAGSLAPLGTGAITPGVTRVSDLANLFYHERILVARMAGGELLELDRKLGEPSDSTSPWQSIHPRPDPARINRKCMYTVAVPFRTIKPLVRVANMAIADCRVSETHLADAIEQHFPR